VNEFFGYTKITVERPLRLNFQVSREQIERFKTQTAFVNLGISKKKNAEIKKKEVAEGKKNCRREF